jgi:hypothetical protein
MMQDDIPMKHNDFMIGSTFCCDDGLWRCTDIGTRIITAIRIDRVIVHGVEKTLERKEAEAEGWFNGPPYAVAEVVFDENDMMGCSSAK